MTIYPSLIRYSSFAVHDTSLAVKDKVTQKLRHTPKQLQKQASHVVSRFKTPARVAPILSKRLCKVVAERLSEKGICVKLEEYFRFVLDIILTTATCCVPQSNDEACSIF